MRFLLLLLFGCAPMLGCVKQTISITSEPGGALVWVNDREVGRTPLEIDFLYYGEYDVRVEREGQEPIMTTRWAGAPSRDAPVVDLAPVELFSKNKNAVVLWHFDMEQRNDNPVLLLQRAGYLRKATIGSSSE